MTDPSGRLTVTLSALPPAEVLEPLWRELEQRSDASFFQTWHWIGTWLGCLHPGMAAELLRVERPGAVVGLGIVIRRTVRPARMVAGAPAVPEHHRRSSPR